MQILLSSRTVSNDHQNGGTGTLRDILVYFKGWSLKTGLSIPHSVMYRQYFRHVDLNTCDLPNQVQQSSQIFIWSTNSPETNQADMVKVEYAALSVCGYSF